MSPYQRSDARRCWAWRALAVMLLVFGSAQAAAGDPAAALRERYKQLTPQLERSSFHQPLKLDSSETSEQLQGSIDAVVSHSFALVREQLQRPTAWCEILMLHINTKHCSTDGNSLTMYIGRKHDQPLDNAYRVAFAVQPDATGTGYVNMRLSADSGPFSTRDYRIHLEAIPLDGGSKTFLHLRYAYGYGFAAKLAMQGYLATAGAAKVGFTQTSGTGYIGGMRGAVERNTMRYYLAIDAYLASLAAPAAEQRTRRLETWFTATEQYARQLHEMDRADYLAMKRNEYRRLQGAS
jgi:hypothetical protein